MVEQEENKSSKRERNIKSKIEDYTKECSSGVGLRLVIEWYLDILISLSYRAGGGSKAMSFMNRLIRKADDMTGRDGWAIPCMARLGGEPEQKKYCIHSHIRASVRILDEAEK